ncbi:hypothetical protein EV127DRAFT_371071 [Xylaria flabelliformis]|nr:hypothetical protein EV127DRAFT_371071 [Xylaria flabelliformis]
MHTNKEEQEPFLLTEGTMPPSHARSTSMKDPKWRLCYKLNGVICIFQLLLLTFNLISLRDGDCSAISHLSNGFSDSGFELAFSPAESAIQYKIQHLGFESSPFTGEPRPELDQAWSRLLRSTMVKISKNEMTRMNKTSIAMKDGSGYLGYLEAHHMLHCVKRLYQFQHQDAYPKLRSGGTFSLKHHEHCLEVLRQGIMCNADVSVNTFFWEDPNTIKGDRSGNRKCVDWDSIQAWADGRAVDYDNIDDFLAGLVHTDEVKGLEWPFE